MLWRTTVLYINNLYIWNPLNTYEFHECLLEMEVSGYNIENRWKTILRFEIVQIVRYSTHVRLIDKIYGGSYVDSEELFLFLFLHLSIKWNLWRFDGRQDVSENVLITKFRHLTLKKKKKPFQLRVSCLRQYAICFIGK